MQGPDQPRLLRPKLRPQHTSRLSQIAETAIEEAATVAQAFKEAITPALQGKNTKSKKPVTIKMSRRTLLAGGATLFGAGLLAGTRLSSPQPENKPKAGARAESTLVATTPPVIKPEAKNIPPYPEAYEAKPSSLPFDNMEANQVAEKKGFHAGSFFETSYELYPKFTAFLGNELLPIFPPAVYLYKDVIYEVSQKYKVPPNVVAMIISVESAGNANAVSHDQVGPEYLVGLKTLGLTEMKGMGLCQVTNENFVKMGVRDEKQMLDPRANIDAGVKIFSDSLGIAQDLAKADSQNYPAARVYLRAMFGYNAGPAAIAKPFDDLSVYTKYYHDNIFRYMMAAEIAGAWKKQGLSDFEITRRISSPELSARNFALKSYRERLAEKGKFNYTTYNQALDFLTGSVLKDPADTELKKLFADYVQFFKVPHIKDYQSSALASWIAIGGDTLYHSVEENKDVIDLRGLNLSRK